MNEEDLEKLRKANALMDEAIDSDSLEEAIEIMREVNDLLESVLEK